jgi:hypothetical protein
VETMATKQIVKEARKSVGYEVSEDLGKYPDYRAAALVAANQREKGRIARAVRRVVYMVEIKPRVIY